MPWDCANASNSQQHLSPDRSPPPPTSKLDGEKTPSFSCSTSLAPMWQGRSPWRIRKQGDVAKGLLCVHGVCTLVSLRLTDCKIFANQMRNTSAHAELFREETFNAILSYEKVLQHFASRLGCDITRERDGETERSLCQLTFYSTWIASRQCVAICPTGRRFRPAKRPKRTHSRVLILSMCRCRDFHLSAELTRLCEVLGLKSAQERQGIKSSEQARRRRDGTKQQQQLRRLFLLSRSVDL